MKTQELKSTLSIISKHVTSLIRAAENRARDGDSPSPTARGGLGVALPTKSAARAAAAAAAQKSAATQATAAQTAATRAIPATTAALSAQSAAAGPKTRLDLQEDTAALQAVTPVIAPRLVGAKGFAFAAGAPSVLPAHAEDSPVGVPARTRVLRRVSSIRKLFLGATKTGKQLELFAEQMGLPHDVVVTHFQVCTRK